MKCDAYYCAEPAEYVCPANAWWGDYTLAPFHCRVGYVSPGSGCGPVRVTLAGFSASRRNSTVRLCDTHARAYGMYQTRLEIAS